MSKKGKLLLGTFILLFVCLVVWVVRTTPDAPPPTEKVEPPTVMEYEGNTISEEVNGVKIWELTADKVKIELETQNAELENLTGNFYQEDGQSIKLSAKHGIYEHATKNIHIDGDVVLTTSEGAKLVSGKLDWTSEEGLLIATEDVKISKDDIIATGDRAESKDGFKRFWLKGNAHVIKGVKNDDESSQGSDN